MNHTSSALLLIVVSGCARSHEQSQSAPRGGAPAPEASALASEAAHSKLDQLDTRASVPLLPMMANHQKQNMRDHLVAVQEIVAALAEADFERVERAAGRIGYSEQMGQTCSHMGAGAPGFSERAIEFHQTADRIAAAARERDMVATLREVSATLQNCTSCHATWKQRVVGDEQWKQLTALVPEPTTAR